LSSIGLPVCLPVFLAAIGLAILPAVGLTVFLPVERGVAAALPQGNLAERRGHQAGKNIWNYLAHRFLLWMFPVGGVWGTGSQDLYRRRRKYIAVPSP
jgi:hypothetical protein